MNYCLQPLFIHTTTKKIVTFFFCNCLLQGRKWHICDQFQSTSATVNGNTIFVGDVVEIGKHTIKELGKVQKFYAQVVKNRTICCNKHFMSYNKM